jgi:hypothetical protein
MDLAESGAVAEGADSGALEEGAELQVLRIRHVMSP